MMLESENVKPGMVVRDTEKPVHYTSVMEFVKEEEEDGVCWFKAVSGCGKYDVLKNGLIFFRSMPIVYENI